MEQFPDNVVELINARLGGHEKAMGLSFVSATPDEFVAQLEVGQQHLQTYGLVHGGVLAGMVETVCSVAAALNVFARGCSVVGLDNATSFLRAVRSGNLRCTATPLARGRRSHVWEAQIVDDDHRLVASGRVRLLVLERGASAAGQSVKFTRDSG